MDLILIHGLQKLKKSERQSHPAKIMGDNHIFLVINHKTQLFQ